MLHKHPLHPDVLVKGQMFLCVPVVLQCLWTLSRGLREGLTPTGSAGPWVVQSGS